MRAVFSTPGAGGSPPSSDQSARALARLREEHDRIAANVTALEHEQAHRLLKDAELHGTTLRRWEETAGRLTRLWRLFHAYSLVVEKAERLHARSGDESRAEAARLLNGPSVELEREETRLAERGLLDGRVEALTLAEAVDQMTAAYEAAAETVGAVDAAWSALLPLLAEVEADWERAETPAASPETAHPRFVRLKEEVQSARRAVLGDPLSFTDGAEVDRGPLERLAARIAELRGELEEATRLREHYGELAERLSAAIDEVAAVSRRAREAHDAARAKIADPGLAPVPDRTADLHRRLSELSRLREGGRRLELVSGAAETEAAITAALAAAHADLEAGAGLLRRRAELRGRWEAYRVKAARLGLAEDPETVELHQRLRGLLWTAPCDLRAGTAALARYRRILQRHEQGGGDDDPVH